MRLTRIRTRRLLLRPLGLGDLDNMAALLGDTEALAYWGAPLDHDGARAWIERNIARYDRDGFGRCAILLRASGELVGDCGLVRTDVEGVPEVELGWIVRHDQWGRGIATEAGAAWRDYAFERAGMARIVSMISEVNTASRHVAEKLGLKLERPAVWGGEPMLMHSMARTEPQAPPP